jgi:hypothetical protein
MGKILPKEALLIRLHCLRKLKRLKNGEALMKLYKFRSLDKFDYVLDILLNKRLYCAPYTELNDPFEGLLWHSVHARTPDESPHPNLMLTGTFEGFNSVKELFSGASYTKICSLSADFSDVRLWSNYADGHRGVAIEINFPDIPNDKIVEVKYTLGLPKFKNKPKPRPQEILSYKTDHWAHEREYRIINDNKYFPITDGINAVLLGSRISNEHLQLLSKLVPPEWVSKTEIDLGAIKVKVLNR